MTAARCLHEGLVDVAAAFDEVVARHRDARHRMQLVGPIGAAHASVLQVVEDLGQDHLRFADAHRVAMRQRLLRHEARMHAAHDDRHATPAELVGDLVAAIDVGGHRGDPDHVAFQVEIDLLDVLIGEDHLVALARDGGGDSEQPGDGRIERAVEIERTRCQRIRLRIDEMDDSMPHRCLRISRQRPAASKHGLPWAGSHLQAKRRGKGLRRLSVRASRSRGRASPPRESSASARRPPASCPPRRS